MDSWSRLPPDELIRRRKVSVEEMEKRRREEFQRWYQEKCDEDYWRLGQCCAGCDFWQSDMGNVGFCTASGIVPGEDVMKSLGIHFCSYTPAAGFPVTRNDHYCGRFKDDFDWSTLDRAYLRKIGALERVEKGQKPERPAQ